MTCENLLGLPLELALERLHASGIEPKIIESRAPRRPAGNGALRVVRIKDGGREVTACGFETSLKEEEHV